MEFYRFVTLYGRFNTNMFYFRANKTCFLQRAALLSISEISVTSMSDMWTSAAAALITAAGPTH